MHESGKKIQLDSCRLEMTVKAIGCRDKTELGEKWSRRVFGNSMPMNASLLRAVLRFENWISIGQTDSSWRCIVVHGTRLSPFARFIVPSFSNVSLSAPTKSLLHFHKEDDSFRKILKRSWSVESTMIFASFMMLITIILITRTGTNKSNANNVIITYYGRWMHIQFVWCNNNTVINNNR